MMADSHHEIRATEHQTSPKQHHLQEPGDFQDDFCMSIMCSIFFINNEILLKPKKRPNYTGCIQLGTNTVTHKLQASIKALTKTIEWQPKTVIQSKSLWKKSFRSHPVLSVSSKLRLFLSCQIDHIKQWGTAFLVKLLWWSPNFPCQQANSSTTVFGIIEWTPNKANTKVHNSTAIQQWRERWSTDSPLLLHTTNPI